MSPNSHKEHILKILGIIMLALGALGLLYGGFSYVSRDRIIDAGPLQVDANRTHAVPIAPLVSFGLLAGGAAILVAGSRRRLA